MTLPIAALRLLCLIFFLVWKRGLASYILFSGEGADRRGNGSPGTQRMTLEANGIGVPPKKRIIIDPGFLNVPTKKGNQKEKYSYDFK